MMIQGKSSVKNTSVRKKHSARETKRHTNVIKLKEEALRRKYPVGCTAKTRGHGKSLPSRTPYGIKDRSPIVGCQEMKE